MTGEGATWSRLVVHIGRMWEDEEATLGIRPFLYMPRSTKPFARMTHPLARFGSTLGHAVIGAWPARHPSSSLLFLGLLDAASTNSKVCDMYKKCRHR